MEGRDCETVEVVILIDGCSDDAVIVMIEVTGELMAVKDVS